METGLICILRCYHFTHPFEDIEVKQNAPELLAAALKSKRKKCMIGTGSMSDPYMHCEDELRLTRKSSPSVIRRERMRKIKTINSENGKLHGIMLYLCRVCFKI